MEISDEQRKEIEAKLAKMSPEELQQLQAQQCIFCQIAQGKIPAKTIYEDEHLTVVLDINPASPGHCLILPKQHYMVLPQVPQEIVEHMFKIAKQVSHTLLRSLKVDGTSWFVANGQLAGQRAQHVMVHVIPRIDDDGIGLMIPKNDLSADEKTTLKSMIGPVIASALGKEQTTPHLESKEEEKNLPVEKEEPSTPPTQSSDSTNEVNATDATPEESTDADQQTEAPAEPEPEQQEPSDGERTDSIEDEENSGTEDEPEQEMTERGEEETHEESDEQPATDTDEEREDDDSEEDDHDKQSGKPNLDDITRFLSK